MHWGAGHWELMNGYGVVMYAVDSHDEFPPRDGWRVCDLFNTEAPNLSIASDISSLPLPSRDTVTALMAPCGSGGATGLKQSSTDDLVAHCSKPKHDPTAETATMPTARDCQITVTTLAGNVIAIAKLDLSETGIALKAQVAATTGLHESHQRLMLEGTEISNVVTMSELGFERGVDETVLLVSGLTICADCGRKFTHQRIEAHSRSCARTSQRKAKTFNSVRQRLDQFGSKAEHLISAAAMNFRTTQKENVETNRTDEEPTWKMKSHEIRVAMEERRRQVESDPRRAFLECASVRAAAVV